MSADDSGNPDSGSSDSGNPDSGKSDSPSIDAPSIDEGGQGQLWQRDVDYLIAAERQRQADEVDPLRVDSRTALSGDVTTSELISSAEDPLAFLRRQLRPVPYKPNAYAKRGTAFHLWVESHLGGSRSLISESDLPGMDDYPVEETELTRLKENFAASEWGSKTPYSLEAPFALRYRGYFIRGRIDAVFHEGDDEASGWTVVDWKTGNRPTGPDLQRALIQLAVYKEAWTRILKGKGIENPQVSAAFYYVRHDTTYQPPALPSLDELGDGPLASLFGNSPTAILDRGDGSVNLIDEAEDASDAIDNAGANGTGIPQSTDRSDRTDSTDDNDQPHSGDENDNTPTRN